MMKKAETNLLLCDFIAKVQNALVPLFMEETHTDLLHSIKLIEFLESRGAPNIGLSIKNLMMLLSTSVKEVKLAASQFFNNLIGTAI